MSTVTDLPVFKPVGPRPTVPVPADRRHEFLVTWLPATDPDVWRWIAHFVSTRVPYNAARDKDRIMLYTHRLRMDESNVYEVWCCGQKSQVRDRRKK